MLLGVGLMLGCTGSLDGSPGKRQPAAGDPSSSPTGPTEPSPTGSVPPGTVVPTSCAEPVAPRAPMRRITRFEYSNTLADLLGDTTAPGSALPGEAAGNGFANDADQQSVSSLLAQQYITVARDIAARFTTPQALPGLVPCSAGLGPSPAAAAESACVESFIAALAPRAYRRPIVPAESQELLALFQTIRATSDFATGIAGVLQAILLTPEFLYRPEFGVPVPGRPDLLRPTGEEMASRLSYLYWGTMPDAELSAAAVRGELDTREGVLAHATRMLNDTRSDVSLRFFFDNLLPVSALASLVRDPQVYPTFSSSIGALLREETHQFLRHVIFQAGGGFETLFNAPYTFVNAELAAYYGYPGVTGSEFRQVSLNTAQRLGLLTQGGVMAGTAHSNVTNPVKRGAFVMKELLCQRIPPPSAEVAAMIKAPEPYEGATARDRFTAHAQDPGCVGCHTLMDPIGLGLENFDAVGLFRDTENNVLIDASGQVPALSGPFSGPVELAQKVAESPQAKSCLSDHFMSYAYARTLSPADKCTVEFVQESFATSGYDVRAMLTAVSQSDAFLYLSAVKE
jgi:hypothetical protein